MSTTKQIEANRQNAQSSTGPTSEAGKQRSSLNSTVHGFTGQTLVLTEAEKAPYEAFVQQIRAEFRPCTAESRELLQNYTDLRWSIEQITVQQNNILAIMNVLTAEHLESGNLAAMDAALEPHTRRLKTLGTYELRRRRAAKETLEQFNKVQEEFHEKLQSNLTSAAHAHLVLTERGETWDPKEYGFDCSIKDIEQFLKGRSLGLRLAELLSGEADEPNEQKPAA